MDISDNGKNDIIHPISQQCDGGYSGELLPILPDISFV